MNNSSWWWWSTFNKWYSKRINALKKINIIIGQRELNFKNTPLRNYIGNKIASFIFNYSRKNKILDTQCGLRAIPYSRFSKCLKF